MMTGLFLLFILWAFFITAFALYGIVSSGNVKYLVFFFIGYLPIYTVLLAFSYDQSGSMILVGFFRYLKEIVFVVGFAIFFLLQKDPTIVRYKLTSSDKWMLAFMAICIFFFALPIGGVDYVSKAIYLKNLLLIGFAYFIGRNTHLNDVDLSVLFRWLLNLGLITFLFSFGEQLINTHFHSLINFGNYNFYVNGIEPRGNFGLTWTFEAQNAQRRFGAFFSNPLEMASSMLLVISTGIALFIQSYSTQKKLYYLLFTVIALFALLLAYSRASIAAFFLMLFFVAILLKYYRLLLTGFLLFIGMTVYVFFLAPKEVRYFVEDTLTFQDTSSIGHVVEWLEAIESIISNPQGIGLATSGNAGGVSRDDQVGGENQFLIFGVQMGVLGMLIYIGLLVKIILYALKRYRVSSSQKEKIIAFIVASVKFGFLLPLFTANAESYLFISMTTWWMSGYLMTFNSVRINGSQAKQ